MFICGAVAERESRPPHSIGFYITQNNASHLIGLLCDERSARRRDLHLTTPKTHSRKISMLRWDLNPQSQQESGRRPTN